MQLWLANLTTAFDNDPKESEGGGKWARIAIISLPKAYNEQKHFLKCSVATNVHLAID